MSAVHPISQRVGVHEHLLVVPVVIVGVPQQDSDTEVDVDQRGGDQFAVNHHTRGGDEHRPAPILHVLICEVAHFGILERAPAPQQRAAQADFLVARQCLVKKEVEEVVVHGHDLLHELDVTHEPGHVVGHQLDRGCRANSAGIQGRRVYVPAFHEAEHLSGVSADLQRLPVELAGERVERAHDVGDRAIAVHIGVRCHGIFCLGQHTGGVGLGDHLLAVVDADQILLKDVVVEHVFRSLA